ncbi:histone H3 [Pancytospora philotis]|nr:histone H3 [Pancytospora philotis]
MARTAHSARKSTAPQPKARIEAGSESVASKKPTKSLSVRTPVISQLEKPKKIASSQGKLVLKEIKYYQSHIGFLIPKARILAMIRSIVKEVNKSMPRDDFRFTSASLSILHECIENHLVCLLEYSYMAAQHAKRVTLFASDIRLVQRIKSFGK